ncbi:hypothetical protein GCM10012280_59110 [Wenjunlia tyrosinilytica]|uniref:Uncharacterized protein n=1 Tax=Wenjunlia tyrosinilytica TaxID=1544741 RepID=A0A918E1T9_9ACTN|nr:hypothetical protein GCM10012280_59110 [Wenjunlia tyrosinilytica]
MPSAVNAARWRGTQAKKATTSAPETTSMAARTTRYCVRPTCSSVWLYCIGIQLGLALGAIHHAPAAAVAAAPTPKRRTAGRRSRRKCSGAIRRPMTNQGRNCSTRGSARS